MRTCKAVAVVLLLLWAALAQAQDLLSGPNDAVFDFARDRYLVGNWAGNRIVAIDLQGNQTLFRSGVTRAHGMELRGDVLYVASFHSFLTLDLLSGATLDSIYVPGSQYLGHLALDDTRSAYVTDWSAKKVFRIDLIDRSTSVLVSLSEIPVGVWYEGENSRLVLLPFINAAPILAVSLPGGSLTTIRTTDINQLDAICEDSVGRYYITSFSGGIVYRLAHDLMGTPEIISTGHEGPSGLGYNARDGVLVVTNYDSNSVSYISLNPAGVAPLDRGEGGLISIRPTHPNPFTSCSTIPYALCAGARVTLKVYDARGRKVATLVDGLMPAGSYEAEFDGSGLEGGVFFYRLCSGGAARTGRMVLVP